ncbi:pantoate kinase [Halomicroarcula sp. GCM10025709]|uniref:pantoate kinase n=1 Tax=Haloarcula TaxID=2237 RepID=UPI0024C3E6B8|nr:pantoate kinase [Halomicroarcula sp. YJ-61-S]
MSDEAHAFVPGHVTGFFTVDRDDDPTKAGSRGGGLALSDGVSVTVERAQENAVELDGEQIEMDAVDRVLEALRATAHVSAETDLPLGAGFGVSGGMALGTALAANAAFERGLSYNELVTVAHGAEVQAGTGLGDVVAQARGGIPLRLEPGGPQYNYVDAVPARTRVEYHSLGELSTAEVIDGETDALTAAGERAISQVVREPTLSTFMQSSRQFAREAELLTPEVKRVIDEVTDAGGDASMAMLGETVFTLGTGLTDAGYDAAVCEAYPPGATVEDGA